MEHRTVIAVCGAGRSATALQLEIAEAVGAGLARLGLVVITGGKGGVMEAVSRGAVQAGGVTVALLPGADPGEANPWVQIPLATGVGFHRNSLLVQSASYVVAIGGEYGTASEVAAALNFKRPVVGCQIWGLQRPDGTLDSGVVLADTAEEILGVVAGWLQ